MRGRRVSVIGVAAGFSVITVAMATVSTMAKHMQGDKGGSNQYPNPVLRKPFHIISFIFRRAVGEKYLIPVMSGICGSVRSVLSFV
tara:strand:+ start:3661 stop:3918 length:258 start_codon:yes stop_codon:yes gene_type:complete